jgi:hypothetical protein
MKPFILLSSNYFKGSFELILHLLAFRDNGKERVFQRVACMA